MSCSQYDWKAYALGELDRDHRHQAETHAAACAQCRDELAGLRLTLDALSTLREEEVPRRIAFVSDRVFEPRWFARFWNPTFAAACVVAAAILVHAFAARPAVDSANLQSRINTAVERAVTETEARHVSEMDEIKKQNTLVYVSASGLVRQ